jgi:hypothetical protein
MVVRRHAFEQSFLSSLDNYRTFSEAIRIYVGNVRRIAGEVGWTLTDLDELGLAYVQAMANYVDQGNLSRADAIFRMRLMEKMIVDEYAKRAQAYQEYQDHQDDRRRQRLLDGMAFWAIWQQYLATQRPLRREPVTCFQTGTIITCR